ncbi:MAG: flagellin lysine-N-methylase [Eubacteriaceae bacterium]|nr:flagellin lysine-N-methylase [Eubacteriaceae bacterium]
MKRIRPNYYDEFRCIASDCRHNCCIGWEIDIDDETMEKYRNVTGELSQKLSEKISEEGTAHFILCEDERCPFLDEKNLCEIISCLGEEYLCQICDDHPRFVNFFSDRTEIGLGLACEECARIIVTQKEDFSLIEEDDEAAEDVTEGELAFYEIRNRIFSMLSDKTKPLYERTEGIFEYMNISLPDLYAHEWAEELSQFEILDEAWEDRLEDLAAFKDNMDFPLEKYGKAFENLVSYFLYRHLAGALEDGCLNERIAFAFISAKIIYRICAVMFRRKEDFSIEDIIEISRMYSSEIEYSEENTQEFLDILFEII